MEILCVVEHTPSGDVLRTYEGMARETVTGLLAEGGNTFDFVTEDDYRARGAAEQPIAEVSLDAVGAQTMQVEKSDTASRLDALEARMTAIEAKLG